MASSKFYIEQIKQLIKLTAADKIYWMQLNPTTYYFQSMINTNEHTTTIQRLSTASTFKYILQIQENYSKEIKVDVSSDPTVTSDSLELLFSEVAKSVRRRSQNFFDQFLDTLDN